MSLISLIVVLVVLGVVLYLLNALVPLDPKIRLVINVLVGLFLFIWVMQQLGFIGSVSTVRIN